MRIGKPRHREEEHHPFSGAKSTTTKPFDGGAFTLVVLAHADKGVSGGAAFDGAGPLGSLFFCRKEEVVDG